MTQKPISTISFNSFGFLKMLLDELVENEIIIFYVFIKHFAEPKHSKDTLKDHFHIYIELAKKTDTIKLRKMFNEVVVDNPNPLGCLPIINSKFDDWALYSLHNPIYLASKGLSRTFQYEYNDLITNDEDYLLEKFNNIQAYNIYMEMNNFQTKGLTFEQYVISKNLNPLKINAYANAWELTYNYKFSKCFKKENLDEELNEIEEKKEELSTDNSSYIEIKQSNEQNN